MRWLDYPFYRILFFVVAGIIFQHYNDLYTSYYAAVIFSSLVLVLLYFILGKWITLPKSIFAVSVYVFFFSIGAHTLREKQALDSHHFINQVDDGKNYVTQIKLKQRLAPNAFSDRFYAEVLSLDKISVSGNALVLFNLTDSLDYKVGDRLTVYENINLPAFARNPGEFNYRNYLKSIDVYGQVYVDRTRILEHATSREDTGVLLSLRHTILDKLDRSGLHEKPKGVIEALVLGQRQNVDPEVTKSFRDAGVIHILALSGLHVGIILLILRFLTMRILRLKYGRWVQSVVLIFLLWSFALLTGMSPSIMRAVTMFSFVAIGLNLKRKGSVYHSLALSAFILLIYDPRLLFQVGFQLSYMAVFSIVLIQPVLAGLWTWRNKVKDFFWSIFTVTLSAQIGVAGISLFYFHQFPGLFILGNMLLLPLLPFIIGAALLLIVLLLLNVSTDWLTAVLNYAIEYIIDVISKISSWDAFIIRDVHFSLLTTVLGYVALFSFVLFLLPYFKKSRKERFYLKKPNWMLHLSILTIIVIIGIYSWSNYESQQDRFLVLHQSTGSAISISNKSQVYLFIDLHVMDSTRTTHSLDRLKALENHRGKELNLSLMDNLIDYQKSQLIVVSEDGMYDSSMKDKTVLLSHSPKINLQRLIIDLQPKRIIADGSNYRNVVEDWKKTCDIMGVELLNTYEVGAVEVTK